MPSMPAKALLLIYWQELELLTYLMVNHQECLKILPTMVMKVSPAFHVFYLYILQIHTLIFNLQQEWHYVLDLCIFHAAL